MRGRLGCVVLLSLLAAAGTASAQSASDQARAHYRRALELFDAREYPRALVEFEAAYTAVPNPALLYNIGNVHAALEHSVEAVDAYTIYLSEAPAIADERRAEVEAALARHRDRIGRVTIRANVEGAMLTVDGNDVGEAPLPEPIRLTLGRHTFAARAAGYDTPQTQVDIPGSVETTVELTLRPDEVTRSRIQVRSLLDGVAVFANDREVGVTPLEESIVVSPGTVTIAGRRAGYVDATETVEAVAGGEATVTLELAPDVNAPSEHRGTLRLRVPDETFTLVVDGRDVDASGGRVELPVGAHDVRLSVASRQPVHITLEVPSGGVVELAPELRWTDDALRDQSTAGQTQATVGWVVGGVGLAAAIAGAVIMIVNEPQYAEYSSLEPQFRGPEGCLTLGLDCRAVHGAETEDRFYDLERQPRDALRGTGIAALVIGAAGLTVGLALVLTAPSQEEIDDAAGASARLRLGFDGLNVEGAF